MSAYSDLISGAKGTFTQNDNGTFDKKAMAYFIASDSIVAIEIEGVDVTDQYFSDPSVAIVAGVFIVPRADLGHTVFSEITITGGSVVALLS